MTEINKMLMKITRGISTYHGNVVVIALKGSGVSTLQKLACFSQNYQSIEVRMNKDSLRSDWLLDFKKIVSIAGVEDKGVVY